MKKRLIIFGDSIALGVDTRKSWPQLLLERSPKVFQLYNLSISGETTSELVSRVSEEFERRFRENRTVVIVQHAHNDFWEGEGRVPDIGKTLKNFGKIFDIFSKVPLLCISPVWMPSHTKGDRTYRTDLLEKFVKELQALSNELNIPFINVFSILKGKSSYYTSTWHLNSKGNKLVAELVRERLLRYL